MQRKLLWLRPRLALCFYPHVPLSKRSAARVYGYGCGHSSAARGADFRNRPALLHRGARRSVRLHCGHGPIWHGADDHEAHCPDTEHHRGANWLGSLLSCGFFFLAHVLAIRGDFNSGGLHRRKSDAPDSGLQISRRRRAVLQRRPFVLERRLSG